MATSAPLTQLVARGNWGTVEFAVLRTGSIPAREFFDNELVGDAQARFLNLFQTMANYGQLTPKRFKSEMGKLFAFRHEVCKRQIRFPCFQDGNRWIVTQGFFKAGKWPQNEIDRAQTIMNEYWARKK